ncbi:MAG TPA: hypothetical protein PL110_05185 [Candidatus Eremiobacteraeota bacterium]|nr:hypothetical protein [Candidatus Eremiobacteraeota bacterium]
MNKFLLLYLFSISEGHLVNQILWFTGGLLLIVVVSFMIFQFLWKSFRLEAIKASKVSIILALILTFIWFTILFNTFISLYLIVIIGIIVTCILFITVSKLE